MILEFWCRAISRYRTINFCDGKSRLFSVPESEHHPRIIRRHISRVNFSNKRLERNDPIPNPPLALFPGKIVSAGSACVSGKEGLISSCRSTCSENTGRSMIHKLQKCPSNSSERKRDRKRIAGSFRSAPRDYARALYLMRKIAGPLASHSACLITYESG